MLKVASRRFYLFLEISDDNFMGMLAHKKATIPLVLFYFVINVYFLAILVFSIWLLAHFLCLIDKILAFSLSFF